MTIRIHVTAASIAAAVAAFAAVVPARTGGDKVAFPENHAAGVLFTTVDRPDNKQFRELYTSAEALDAAKKGEPLPSGKRGGERVGRPRGVLWEALPHYR